MPEPKIVTERELTALDMPTFHSMEHTIRAFAAALEGNRHDADCELGTTRPAIFPHLPDVEIRECDCNARLLEKFHAK